MSKRLFSIFTLSLIIIIAFFAINCDDNPTKPISPDNPPEDMVYVEGGTYTMGDVWGDGYANETPTHEVTVSSFYMSKYEVTQKQYKEVMGTNPSDFDGENHPVENVTWYDAIEFCNKLSGQEGLTPCYTIDKENQDPNNNSGYDDLKWTVTVNWNANGYRLPTEDEWEYAARSGGSDDRKWSGTNSWDDFGNYAWYSSNSGDENHPVGTKKPTDLGIYDMSGNVYEWCWDWYGDYSSSSQTDPIGPASGSYRVFRGGSWYLDVTNCRSAVRYGGNPSSSGGGSLGFRLTRSQ